MMSAESLLPTSSYLITVPFPSFQSPTQLVAHLTLFQGPSILLWCGECADGWTSTEMEAIDERQVQPTSSLLIEEHRPPRSFTLPFPTGHLTNEWAVAMTNPRTKTTNSTSLHRSHADLSKPMSARLSKRFSLAQLFLSLSLPISITSALEGPFGGSEANKALLLIEGALGDILKQNLPLNS